MSAHSPADEYADHSTEHEENGSMSPGRDTHHDEQDADVDADAHVDADADASADAHADGAAARPSHSMPDAEELAAAAPDANLKRRLHVSGFTSAMNDEKLIKLVSAFGDVRDAFVVRKPTREGIRYGFVEFANESSATACKEALQNSTLEDGSMLLIKVALPKYGGSSHVPGAKSEAVLNRLYVGNLGNGVTESDVRTEFSVFGEVTQISMWNNQRAVSSSSGRPSAFVEFKYAADAQAAKAKLHGTRALRGTDVETTSEQAVSPPLIVDFAKPTQSRYSSTNRSYDWRSRDSGSSSRYGSSRSSYNGRGGDRSYSYSSSSRYDSSRRSPPRSSYRDSYSRYDSHSSARDSYDRSRGGDRDRYGDDRSYDRYSNGDRDRVSSYDRSTSARGASPARRYDSNDNYRDREYDRSSDRDRGYDRREYNSASTSAAGPARDRYSAPAPSASASASASAAPSSYDSHSRYEPRADQKRDYEPARYR